MNRFAVILIGIALGAACQTTSVSIDYVDVVQLGGITYQKAWTSPGRPLQEGDLGAQYGTVKVRLEGSQDVNHQLQDGDAAFLYPGTPIFRVKGYAASFRLAARESGALALYESDTNPKAIIGADLVDLVGKVTYIGINSPQDGRTELAAIRDHEQVTAMVAMVETAHVDQSGRAAAGPQYFIDFHLTDGTETTRSYRPQSGELARGIILPPAFASLVMAALHGTSASPATITTGQPTHVQAGVQNAYRLYTHCGPDWRTFFDGSYWDLAAPVQPGLGDPYQDGTMTLMAADEARFDYVANQSPASISFHRHVTGGPLKPPLGCD